MFAVGNLSLISGNYYIQVLYRSHAAALDCVR